MDKLRCGEVRQARKMFEGEGPAGGARCEERGYNFGGTRDEG